MNALQKPAIIDIERRIRLAFHLRQLAVGLTSNDDFEKAVGNDVTGGWLPEQFYRSEQAKQDDLSFPLLPSVRIVKPVFLVPAPIIPITHRLFASR